MIDGSGIAKKIHRLAGAALVLGHAEESVALSAAAQVADGQVTPGAKKNAKTLATAAKILAKEIPAYGMTIGEALSAAVESEQSRLNRRES